MFSFRERVAIQLGLSESVETMQQVDSPDSPRMSKMERILRQEKWKELFGTKKTELAAAAVQDPSEMSNKGDHYKGLFNVRPTESRKYLPYRETHDDVIEPVTAQRFTK